MCPDSGGVNLNMGPDHTASEAIFARERAHETVGGMNTEKHRKTMGNKKKRFCGLD